ncbi:MAG: hypothetical protein JXJ04_19080 [Spirochaetales bacterium]|nr:hypothetical protein [Spirochaetales bacterium]
MKKLIFLCIIIVLTGTACMDNKKKPVNTDMSTQEVDNTSNFLPFEVESKITSTTITNKIFVLINDDILNWINNDVIINAVKKSNSENTGRTQEKIDKLDTQWKNSKGIDDFINEFMENQASVYLKSVQETSNGVYSEIFVMDFQGCNVALSSKTSDFWQGDEDKFKIAYNNGKGKIFIDEIEFDESTQENLVQVSLPVSDKSSKDIIGTITIGININKL